MKCMWQDSNLRIVTIVDLKTTPLDRSGTHADTSGGARTLDLSCIRRIL